MVVAPQGTACLPTTLARGRWPGPLSRSLGRVRRRPLADRPPRRLHQRPPQQRRARLGDRQVLPPVRGLPHPGHQPGVGAHRLGRVEPAHVPQLADHHVDRHRPDTGDVLSLKLLGHEVAIAYTGPEGIKVAKRHPPEFILLDIGLPGMGGYEVASRLRRETCGKDAVIVAVSGYGQEEDRRRSKEAGFDHHLIKPLNHDAFISLLAAAGNGHGKMRYTAKRTTSLGRFCRR